MDKFPYHMLSVPYGEKKSRMKSRGTYLNLKKNNFLIIDFQGGSHVAVWACSSFLFSVLKVHGPIFKNLRFFFFPLKNHHSKDVNFKFQLKWSSHLNLQSNFLLQLLISYYVSLIMVTTTICSHVFVNIYQMESLFNCEIWHGLWEKYELSCDSKISKSSKKVKKDRTGQL